MDLNGDGKHDWKDDALFHNVLNSDSQNSSGYSGSSTKGYRVQSKNPMVSATMLQTALYMVDLRNGPYSVAKFKKCAITLVVDDIQKRVLAIWGGNHEFMFDIPFAEILTAICFDAHESKANRHKFQIITKSGDTYEFECNTRLESDPLPFINLLNYEMDCYRNPGKHKHDIKIFRRVPGGVWLTILSAGYLAALLPGNIPINTFTMLIGFAAFGWLAKCFIGWLWG